MNKLFLSITLMLLSCVLAMGQEDVEVKISAPSSVAVGKPFQIKISVNSQNARISNPQFGNLIVMGRSSSTSMSIINGSMTVESSYIYNAAANTPGTYNIPAVTAEVGGKKYTSNSITIEASGEAVENQNQQAGAGKKGNSADDGYSPSDASELFIDVKCNKNEVYVGEQIIMSTLLYSRYNISDFEDFKVPNFSGFWVKDIENPKNITFERIRLNGASYLTALLQKKALFPQKTGTLSIEPYKLDLIVGDFFSRARASAKSKTKTIKVKPLPEGKPDGFGGAVGSFKVAMSTDKTEVNLDDPLTIKVSITGTGNFQLFESPKININSAFEQFEPKTSENINAGAQGVSGSKTFSTVVIARQPGEYVIPAVKFPYFDPASKSYKVAESQEITITVKGERNSSESATNTIIGTEVEDLGSDIRFIKQDGIKLKNGHNQFFNSVKFWVILLMLPILFAGILLFRLQQIKNNANVIGMKRSKAGKTSRKRLKKAEQHIAANQKNEFYVEILSALWGYLSDKLSIPVANLNRENVQEELSKKNIDPAVTEKMLSLIDTCEFEHYAPESMQHPLQEIYDMAAEAIEQMETSIK